MSCTIADFRHSHTGEEELGYDDMVDSMMHAWNGGIPVLAAQKTSESSMEREGQQDSQRRIFCVPEKRLREKVRKTRPEVRLAKLYGNLQGSRCSHWE